MTGEVHQRTKRCTREKMEENITKELAPLRFSQFPGVPPFLNFIVGPGDCPVHPPPILRSSENQNCITLYGDDLVIQAVFYYSGLKKMTKCQITW